MKRRVQFGVAAAAVAAVAGAPAPAAPQGFESMVRGTFGRQTQAIFTVGETIHGYTPPGVLDGLGAFALDANTVRVLANHELGNSAGYAYDVSDGAGGTFSLVGARISYFDVDVATRQVVDSGLAYHLIHDANGVVATDASFLSNNFPGLSRLCSSQYVPAHQFGGGRGLEDGIYFTGEEDGGFFNPVGGSQWALDVATGELWQLPALGRGAWENVTELDTGTTTQVALILADDTDPFNFDAEPETEKAPLYLYVGTKDPAGDFPARNGLRGGTLHVWVSDTGELTPLDFRGSGTLSGTWVPLDNTPNLALADEFGASGHDEYGYPVQGNLWLQAEAAGAFGFSRPEDVSTNPQNGAEVVLASTGVDSYAIDPVTGNGVDSFGTMYTILTDFSTMTADLTILYDADADPRRRLRSPDNLDWADDGLIYVQEDEAEEQTLTGEPLFGPGAANFKEASIVSLERVAPQGFVRVRRIAEIKRNVVLDASISNPFLAVDQDLGEAGEWETSGILDVSALFGATAGTLFLLDVQAHGISDQDDFPHGSRITDDDLVEGGQLLFLDTTLPRQQTGAVVK